MQEQAAKETKPNVTTIDDFQALLNKIDGNDEERSILEDLAGRVEDRLSELESE